jgi:hypothetical protein
MANPQKAPAKFLSFNWLRGVADDSRITVIHRFVLMRLCLHRFNDGRCSPGYDRVADELGVDRATVFRAVDIGIRFGWLAGFPKHGGRAKRNFVFTFPADTSAQQSQCCDGSTVASGRPLHTATVAEKRPNSRRRATQQSQANLQDDDLASEFAPNGSRERGKRERGKTESQTPDEVGEKKEADGEKKRTRKTSASARRQSKNQGERRGATDGDGDAFERFWAVYPRRVAKEAARKAFAKAVANGTAVETLIAGAQRYAAERKDQDPKYTKHPATWLNGGCWEDELPGAPVIDQDGNVVGVEREHEEGRRPTVLERALAMDPGPGWGRRR